MTAVSNYYYAHTIENQTVRNCMEILMGTVRRVITDHENGVFVDQDYVSSTYPDEIQNFKDTYNALSDQDREEVKVTITSLGTVNQLRTIADYFGISVDAFL